MTIRQFTVMAMVASLCVVLAIALLGRHKQRRLEDELDVRIVGLQSLILKFRRHPCEVFELMLTGKGVRVIAKKGEERYRSTEDDSGLFGFTGQALGEYETQMLELRVYFVMFDSESSTVEFLFGDPTPKVRYHDGAVFAMQRPADTEDCSYYETDYENWYTMTCGRFLPRSAYGLALLARSG